MKNIQWWFIVFRLIMSWKAYDRHDNAREMDPITGKQQRGAVTGDEGNSGWMWLIVWGSCWKLWNDIISFFHGFVWRFLPRLPAGSCIKRPGCLVWTSWTPVSADNRCTATPSTLSLLDYARRAPVVALRRASSSALIAIICTLLYPDHFQTQRCLFHPSASTSGSHRLAGNYSGKRKPTECLLRLSKPANPAEREGGRIRRNSPHLGHRRI